MYECADPSFNGSNLRDKERQGQECKWWGVGRHPVALLFEALHCTATQKVAGSIPNIIIGIF